MPQTQYLNVDVNREVIVISPKNIRERLPMNDQMKELVLEDRQEIKDITTGKDKRVIVEVGACSMDGTGAGLAMARQLAPLAREVEKTIKVVKREFPEKPRSVKTGSIQTDWGGFIRDPYMDQSHDINAGLLMTRELMLEDLALGLAVLTEYFDLNTPPHFSDCLTRVNIGARNITSSDHWALMSGSSPIPGAKNYNVDGDFSIAIKAIQSMRVPQQFKGINDDGRETWIPTLGNPNGIIVLRGSLKNGPNYSRAHVSEVMKAIDADPKLLKAIIVDCSHDNCRSFDSEQATKDVYGKKDPQKQEDVWYSVIDQYLAGNTYIVGLSCETNLVAGSQKIPPDGLKGKYVYGQSFTDPCEDFVRFEKRILETHKMLLKHRKL